MPPRKETDLCAEFAEWARRSHLLVYPEVAGWDLVLTVSQTFLMGLPHDPAHPGWGHWSRARVGDQVGVQAKRVGNVEVLAQVLEGVSARRAPQFAAVLVDRASNEFLEVAAGLAVPVWAKATESTRRAKWVDCGDGFWFRHRGIWRTDAEPLELPPVVPDLPAGVQAPRSLTPWRVKALRLCRIIRRVGYLTPEDFKAAGVDRRNWVRQWVRPGTTCGECRNRGKNERGSTCSACSGTPVRYYPARNAVLPDVGWEAVSAQLKEVEGT